MNEDECLVDAGQELFRNGGVDVLAGRYGGKRVGSKFIRKGRNDLVALVDRLGSIRLVEDGAVRLACSQRSNFIAQRNLCLLYTSPSPRDS